MSLTTLSTFIHTLDPALLVLGGMLALLSVAIALTLFRLIRSKLSQFVHKPSDGKLQ